MKYVYNRAIRKKNKQHQTNHQKLNGTLPTDPRSVSCDRVIRYLGLGVRSVGPVGFFFHPSDLAQKPVSKSKSPDHRPGL